MIKALQSENAFLREKCRILEEKQEEALKENKELSENLQKINEELDLYRSIFLVKNLEIKFKPKIYKLAASLKEKTSVNSLINPPVIISKITKEKESLSNFLSFYEKFGVFFQCIIDFTDKKIRKILKHSCEMLKFEFVYLHEEMKSLMSFVENEIQFEISRILNLVLIIFCLSEKFLMIVLGVVLSSLANSDLKFFAFSL